MTWEYKTIRTKVYGYQQTDAKWYSADMGVIPPEVVDQLLNELGEANWELVNFSHIPAGGNDQLMFVLKRPR